MKPRTSPLRQIGFLLVNPYVYLRERNTISAVTGWFGYLVATATFYLWGYLFYVQIDRSFGERTADWLWSSLYFLGMTDGFIYKLTLHALLTTLLLYSLVLLIGRLFGERQSFANGAVLFGASQWQMCLFYMIGIAFCPFSLMTSLIWIILVSLSNYAVIFSISFEWFAIREKWRSAFVSLLFCFYIGLYVLLMFAFIQLGGWLDQLGKSEAVTLTNTQTKVPDALAQQVEHSHYDVIVVGGEPEGVTAALSAARNGLQTLIIEERTTFGGLITHGRLNYLDLPQTKGGRIVSAGIFKEWHALMDNANVTDLQKTKRSFMQMLAQEANIDVSLSTKMLAPVMEGNQLVALDVSTSSGTHRVHGRRFIDATQDADLAALAGAPYFLGSEDLNIKNRFMAVTPIIHLVGVDWSGVREAAEQETFGAAHVTHDTVAGFGKLFDMYKPVTPNSRLRGLNMGRVFTEDGEHFYINALLIFGVNGLDEHQKAAALEQGNVEAEHVVRYLRENMPGFANARIASPATELYVRETRHVRAEYQLQMADIWYERDQWDSIGYGSYPVDIQPYTVNDKGAIISDPVRYAIPFRSLVPLNVEHLLVVGRSAGFSSVAFGSARVIPTGMVSAQAAGVASKISLDENVSFRELARNKQLITQLRRILKAQGAEINRIAVRHPYEGEWFDKKIGFLMNYGLLVGGYRNDLRVHEPFSEATFRAMWKNGVKRINPDWYEQHKQVFKAIGMRLEKTMTRDELASYVAKMFLPKKAGENAWQQLHTANWVDQVIYERLDINRPLTRAEGFYIMSLVLQKFERNAR